MDMDMSHLPILANIRDVFFDRILLPRHSKGWIVIVFKASPEMYRAFILNTNNFLF